MNIKSSGAVVLLPVGHNDKHKDLSSGQASHLTRERLEVHVILFLKTNKLKIQEVGWPNRWCQRSAVAKMQGDQ